jgi:DEAD/DEAH box helicase domain-containing protein
MKTGVHSPLCKEGNQVSSKRGAHLILRGILGLEIDVDSIPTQDDGLDWSTVVEATSVRPVGNVPVEIDEES